jgi:hypothetical protein
MPFVPVLTGHSLASEVLHQARGKLPHKRSGRCSPSRTRSRARALAQGTSPVDLERLWELDLQRIETVRRRYPRYPYCE